jgi:predicted CoA-binding protein
MPVANIPHILRTCRTIAIIGLSGRPERDSYGVAENLIRHGYKVIPVNPMIREVFGLRAYPDLSSVPEKVDIVNIFRRSDQVPPIVDEAIKINAKVIWMQLGIINEEAAQKAREAGLQVVMNRCIKVEHMANIA